LYGYGSKEELQETHPAYFCKNVMDIIGILFGGTENGAGGFVSEG
jgi:hypothetical protein